MQTKKKQNRILAAILKAVSFEPSSLPYRDRFHQVNDSELYMLKVGKIRVILKYVENKILIVDIMGIEQINSFNKSYKSTETA